MPYSGGEGKTSLAQPAGGVGVTDAGTSRDERRLLADVARRHFLGGESKVDLAKRFSVSRFQIARMLQDARDIGIVTITVSDPSAGPTALEARLAGALGVAEVRIADGDAGDGSDSLGRLTMRLVAERIRPGHVLGISWSRALDRAARHVPALPPCEIVQLAGALRVSEDDDFGRIILQLGQRPGVRTWPIHAPLVVGSPATADDLVTRPEIAGTLARADALDLAVVAVGGWSDGESTVWDRLGVEERESCARAGAVAEISGRLLDAEGRAVVGGIDDRIIGVRLEQLRSAGCVIAVARSARRAVAVRAAARSGIIDCLIVDRPLASALAGLVGSAGREGEA